MQNCTRHVVLCAAAVSSLLCAGGVSVSLAAESKPNILIIWGDDIGTTNGYDDGHGHTYKVHLDGNDQSKFLTTVEGTVGKNNGVKSARDRFYYTDDDDLLVGMRMGDYKASFAEQRMPGTMAVWGEPFVKLRMTKLYNLMQDPFERADITSNTYWGWIMNHVPQVYQGMEGVTDFMATFKEFPPRSVPPRFNPANMLDDELREIKVERKLREFLPLPVTQPTKDKE